FFSIDELPSFSLAKIPHVRFNQAASSPPTTRDQSAKGACRSGYDDDCPFLFSCLERSDATMKRPSLGGSPRSPVRSRRVWSGWRLETLETRTLLSLARPVVSQMGEDDGFLDDGAVTVSGLNNPLTSRPAAPSPPSATNINTGSATPAG